MNDGQRLGAAMMEANATRIPYATFACTVSGKDLKEMGAEAVKVCQAYFGAQPFEITDLDADAVQSVALQTIGYTARVRARAR